MRKVKGRIDSGEEEGGRDCEVEGGRPISD